jgi:hypothetical protein
LLKWEGRVMLKFSTCVFMAGMMASSLVFAQQASPPSPAGQQQAALTPPQQPQWSAEDGAAFTDARIAALKAGLVLKPDQQKAWDGFEKVLRDVGKQQRDRIAQARSAPAPADMVEAMRRRAEAMAAAAAGLKQVADATDPLYRALDDSQKRRMAALLATERR